MGRFLSPLADNDVSADDSLPIFIGTHKPDRFVFQQMVVKTKFTRGCNRIGLVGAVLEHSLLVHSLSRTDELPGRALAVDRVFLVTDTEFVI